MRKVFALLLASLLFAGGLQLSFNRYYDYKDLTKALKALEKAYPKFLKLISIGKSYEGRDIWLMIINNPDTGPELSKPAMLIDGNIHGNEIQGAEAALYTIYYLMKNYNKSKFVKELVDTRVFYVVPTINPDGRAHFFADPNNPNSMRTVAKPRDDDMDGRVDEDGYEDLDGDGNIVMMIKKVEGGQWKFDEKDPRILRRVKPGEKGEYMFIGYEGIDNDGDGLLNEDPIGYYDPNRDWGYNWQPRYIQMGAGEYPFCLPETRALAEFMVKHPNIAGYQSYHNFGGMILRGPGAVNLGRYPLADVRYYDYLGKEGEKMLPGYKYLVVYKDLYTVYGGSLDFAYCTLGIYSFSNELFTLQQDFNKDGKVDDEERMYWNDYLLHGTGFVKWKKFNHPQYGEVLLGGWVKFSTRIPPSFMLEEMCHRNNSFVLFHAYHLPKPVIKKIEVKKLGGDLYRVRATVFNERILPTRSYQAVFNNIGRRDYMKITGKNIKVITGGILLNPISGQVKLQEHQPERIWIDTVPGMSAVTVEWLVKGKGRFKVIFDSLKGGHLEKEHRLK